ncbi:MAG: DUF4249 domain-containing protein [Bacteroidales bacterium]|nr:DUF4249 domain-containing protein [Bacteroidales bacterium]
MVKPVITYTVIAVLFFGSCTEIIDLKLKNTEPRVVIEAVLNASDSTFKVDITMSNDFYETGDFEKISEAEVVLKKNDEISYSIPETEDGIYFSENIETITNDEFQLSITIDGKVYEATTKTPYSAEIANIIPAPFIPPGGGQQNDTTQYFQIMTLWKDSLGVDNYYRLKAYVNNSFSAKDYILTDDRVGDGDTLGVVIVLELYSGDLLKLELLSTDKKYFDYFMDLAIIQGQGPSSATPYNPKGNFNNGALGYFGIYGVSEFEFMLP